jgi:hypothetical protein
MAGNEQEDVSGRVISGKVGRPTSVPGGGAQEAQTASMAHSPQAAATVGPFAGVSPGRQREHCP